MPPPPPAPPSPIVDPGPPTPGPGPDPGPVAKAGMFAFLLDNPLLAVGGLTVLGGLAWYFGKGKR